MKLLHYDNAHFDLIISKYSRLADNVMPTSKNDETSKELLVLKEKYEKLELAYKESLMKIEKLKSKSSNEMAVEDDDDEIEKSRNKENNEEDIFQYMRVLP